MRVEANGVAEQLKSLEVHKAAGPDEIPAQLLKETSDLLAPSLRLQLLFTEHHYTRAPYQQTEKSICCTNFQEGQSYHTYIYSNYRPVSLTCV